MTSDGLCLSSFSVYFLVYRSFLWDKERLDSKNLEIIFKCSRNVKILGNILEKKKSIQDRFIRRVVLKWIRRNWELGWHNKFGLLQSFLLNIHLIMHFGVKKLYK